MPTVVDQLLVTLGLDPSEFKKGAQEAAKAQEGLQEAIRRDSKEQDALQRKHAEAQRKLQKDLEQRAKGAAQAFGKIRNEVMALVASMVGLNQVGEEMKIGVKLRNLADITGMDARHLDAWSKAVRGAGGSAEEGAAGIQAAAEALTAFKNGNPAASGSALAFLKYGGAPITQKDDVETYMEKQADLLQRLRKQRGEQVAWMAAKEMGLGQAQFELMKNGGAALHRTIEDLARASGKTEEFTERMVRLNKAWNALRNSISNTADEWASSIEPALEKILKLTTRVTDAFHRMIEGKDGKHNAVGHQIHDVLHYFGIDPALPGDADYKAPSGPQAHTSTTSRAHKPPTKPAPAASAPPQSSSPNAPRGVRNNNPGNIRFGAFAQAHGATGRDDKGFAVFPTQQAGEAAARALLGAYLGRGDDTIRKIVSKWAPASENNTSAYITAVSRQTGISPDARVSAAQLAQIAQAIYSQENGRAWSHPQTSIAGIPTGAMAGRQGNSTTINNTTSTTTIGTINVQTSATDAKGIADDIGGAIRRKNAWLANDLTG